MTREPASQKRKRVQPASNGILSWGRRLYGWNTCSSFADELRFGRSRGPVVWAWGVSPADGAGAVTLYVATAGPRHQACAFDSASGGPRQRSRQFHAGGCSNRRRRQPRHDYRHADQNGILRRRRHGRRERHHQRRDQAAAARLDRGHAAERPRCRIRGDAERPRSVHQHSRYAGLWPRQHSD